MNRQIAIRIVVIGCLVLAASSSSAQGVAVGIKGGVSVSNVDAAFLKQRQIPATIERRIGAVAGGFARLAVSDIFSIQPEVLFAQKGATVKLNNQEGTLTLNYVEIPVLAHAAIPTGGSVRPIVFAGPAVAFRTSAKANVAGQELNFDEEVKKLDLGVAFGAGVVISGLTIEGRYTQGLSNINERKAGVTETVRNRVFAILVGFGS